MENYKITWSSKSMSDLQDCISFVMNVSKESALSLLNDILVAVDSLQNFPERNSIFDMPKSFPFVIRKQLVNQRYAILYSIKENEIILFRILDLRRKFAALL